jgi:hypothetical protein
MEEAQFMRRLKEDVENTKKGKIVTMKKNFTP